MYGVVTTLISMTCSQYEKGWNVCTFDPKIGVLMFYKSINTVYQVF